METYVSFPNIAWEFLQNIRLNRVAFTLFNEVDVYWYGIIITCGIAAAFIYSMLRSKREGFKSDDIIDLAIFTISIAVIGARVYYIATSFDEFKKESFRETLRAMINIRNGGLAIYGAIIFGAVTALTVCKVKKMNILKIFDILSPAVMMGQIMGRWGNFVNAEAYGTLEKYCFFGFETATPGAASLPWAMQIDRGFETELVHPTFLYESLWNLLGLIIILAIVKHKKYDGQLFLLYFAFYGGGRAFIEGFRTDSLYVGSIRISQLLGFVAFVICTSLLVIFAFTGKKIGLKCGPAYMKSEGTDVKKDENAEIAGERTGTDADSTKEVNEAVTDNAEEGNEASAGDINEKIRDAATDGLNLITICGENGPAADDMNGSNGGTPTKDMSKILDGKAVSAAMKEKIKHEAAKLQRRPGLAVIMVGDDPASAVYVRNKERACEELGFYSEMYRLPADTPEKKLLMLIEKLNHKKIIDGILVQLPLPEHIDPKNIISAITPEKDVDAFHPINTGKIMNGECDHIKIHPALQIDSEKIIIRDHGLVPCTPAGIMEILSYYNIPIAGKHCVIIGRSNIVGKPCAMLMLSADATVTVCHSKTQGLKDICRGADILVAAVGKANFVKEDMVKEGAVIIDVGINRGEDGKLCGDVDFEHVYEKASYITPVPGGVGPMTISMLMKNTLTASEIAQKS